MTLGVTGMHPSLLNAVTPVHAAHVNGVELHFTDTRTDGTTVILLHGGMGDLESWPHQQRALRVRYRVVSYSRRHSHPNRNPAHPGDRAYCIDDDIDDFLALQAALHLGPSHLVATSYGALLALVIALRSTSQVASLVLAEPPLHRWARVTPVGERLYDAFMQGVWRAAGDAFDSGEPQRAMQLLIQGMWGRPMLESWPDDRVDAAMRNAGAMNQLTRMRDPFPSLDRSAVARLAMPVLLVQGEQTSALHRQVMNELAQGLCAAKRIEVPNAGHGSPNENPRAFNAAVERFLESLTSPSEAEQ
jgi:pimeloyl-ACP methyl ester carboxylesterase